MKVTSRQVVWEIVNPFLLLRRSRLCELHLRQGFIVSPLSRRHVSTTDNPLVVLLGESWSLVADNQLTVSL